MKKLSLEEFAVVMYTEYIKRVMSSILRSEEVGFEFYKRDPSEQKEIESLINGYSVEIAEKYVGDLKSAGLLKETLSEEEEKTAQELLNRDIKDFIENVKKNTGI